MELKDTKAFLGKMGLAREGKAAGGTQHVGEALAGGQQPEEPLWGEVRSLAPAHPGSPKPQDAEATLVLSPTGAHRAPGGHSSGVAQGISLADGTSRGEESTPPPPWRP